MKTEVSSLSSDNSADVKRPNCWREFIKSSSCAALAKLGETQSKCVRAFWIVALCCGVLLTAVSTYGSSSSFFNMAASSEMIIEKSADRRLDYPKFHICSSNMFNLSTLARWGFDDERIVSYLTLATSLFSVSPNIMNNYTLELELENRFGSIMRSNNLTVEQIYTQALLKCDEVIAGCITPANYLDSAACCARYFGSKSFSSPIGACVTTRSVENHFQATPTLSFGFTVIVRNGRQKFQLDNAVVNPVIANQRAVAFSVSDNLTHPAISLIRDRHYVKTGQWISLAIARTVMNDEEVLCPLMANRRCVRRDNEHDYHYLVPGHEHYTQMNCFYASRQGQITESQGCYVNTFPPTEVGFPMCAPKNMINLSRGMFSKIEDDIAFQQHISDGIRECISECRREVFSLTPRYSDFELAPNFNFGNWSIQMNESRDMVALNFYYPSATYTHLINHYPTINQWLGVLGGNLGLFLGASMISIIEFILFCCCRFRQRRPLSYSSAMNS